MLEKIDFKSRKITYNEFNIDFSKPLARQVDYLKEDLLQVVYDKGYIIDLGWYPEFDENGCVVVNVIRNLEWNMPIFDKRTRTECELRQFLQEAVDFLCN